MAFPHPERHPSSRAHYPLWTASPGNSYSARPILPSKQPARHRAPGNSARLPGPPHAGGSVLLPSAPLSQTGPKGARVPAPPPASTDQSLLFRGADRRAVRQGGHLGIARLPAVEGTPDAASRHDTSRPHSAAPRARDSRAMRAGPPLYSAARRQVGAWLRPPRPDMSEHDPARRCRVTAGRWSAADSRHGTAEGRPPPAPLSDACGRKPRRSPRPRSDLPCPPPSVPPWGGRPNGVPAPAAS